MEPIKEYGFTPVHSSATKLLATDPPSARPEFISVAQTPIPSTALAQRVNEYVKSRLPVPVYNHSLRVYHYGLAIKRYRFPEWKFSDETYFLACLLHDIATTDENLNATKLSFEFHGGLIALDVLQSPEAASTAPKEQAESVAEAIIRHQDLCEKGKITAVGQLLQLATIFDNAGLYDDIVHRSTIEDVTKSFPRLDWSNCFARTIKKENTLKPWGHTTTLGEEDFPAMVLGNKLMAPFEGL